MLRAAAVLCLFACLPASAGTLAEEAAVSVAGGKIAAGAPVGSAREQLDCSASKVQSTISRCALKPASAPFSRILGRAVAAVTLNLHFQGDVVNMSVELSGVAPDALLGELKSQLTGEPRVEYWADDEHLFASYIWVDGKTEVELTLAVKGPAGKTILYVSSLAGNRPPNPADAPK